MRPALLVYDGDCAFCQRTVDRLRAVLERFPLAVPSHAVDLATLGLAATDVERYVWLVDASSGRRWRGADAFSALLAGQPGALPRLAGRALMLPLVRDVAAVGYRAIAANRHRLPGGTPACALPSAGRPAA